MLHSTHLRPALDGCTRKVKHLRQIAIIGAGRVGCPTAAVLASHHPTIQFNVFDNNLNVYNNWRAGGTVFQEPGLADLLHPLDNIKFLSSTQIEMYAADMVMICIPLPGSCSDVCTRLKPILAKVTPGSVVVIRSTVQVGSLNEVKRRIHLPEGDCDHIPCKTNIIVTNPEFLSAGSSIRDLQRPDRVVIGYDIHEDKISQTAALERLYKQWVPHGKIFCTSYKTAELVKLGANIMRAQRIIGMNTLHALAENLKVDAAEVRDLIGMDRRLQGHNQNLRTGIDGPCLPNDIKTVASLAESCHLPEVKRYWDSVAKTNAWSQKSLIINTVSALKIKLVAGARVAVVGFAFKPHTDEFRHSRIVGAFAARLVVHLVITGFEVSVYDPLCAITDMRNEIVRCCERGGDLLKNGGSFALYNQELREACEGVHAMLLTHGSAVSRYATADE